MIYLPIALGCALALIGLKLFLCAPSAGRARCSEWKGTLFAHRGLWGEAAAENGLKAFDAACEKGYGIELDVQFTADKQLVVFHDDDLNRICGVDKQVRDMTLAELRELNISDNGEKIPTFDEALALVAGRAPLLVEIKNAPDISALTRATAERLAKYQGRYLMESFNPFALRWLKKHAPNVMRGQLVCRAADYGAIGKLRSLFLSTLTLNFMGRPDFIAYPHDMSAAVDVQIHRRLFKTPLAAWTVRDVRLARELKGAGEMPIFEGVTP